MKLSQFTFVFSTTIPVMMGYVPLGIVFGFLMVQNGAEWWHAPLMSLLVFAGAAQFLAIGLLAIQASIIEITLAVLIVNLRHIFYGISMLNILPNSRLGKAYMISTLTDENYSILTGMPEPYAKTYAIPVMAINHVYWTLSALVGTLIGQIVTTQIEGLEFSLTALFTVLAVEQYRRLRNPLFPAIALLAYVLAVLLAWGNPLFPAICIATAAILLISPANKTSTT